METTAKILIKKAKAVKLEDAEKNWYNFDDASAKDLEKFKVGDLVTVEYTKNKTFRNVTKIGQITVAKEEVKQESVKKCACGATIKDAKYDTCYTCSQKGTPPQNKEKTSVDTKTTGKGGGFYGTSEDIAGKEVGCAANCASTILSGRQEDPATLLETFSILFRGILDKIRAAK